LEGTTQAAFDGERILVTNFGNYNVSWWRVADLSLLGSLNLGGNSAWGARAAMASI
jgi:hypothetical protein